MKFNNLKKMEKIYKFRQNNLTSKLKDFWITLCK